MEIKNIYPDNLKLKGRFRAVFTPIVTGILWLGVLVSFLVNFYTGAPWWSAVVLASALLVQNVFLSPRLVERNLIGFFISLSSYSSIVLFSISMTLSPGWDFFVIPIVCSGSILLCTILLLADKEGQKNSIHSSAMLSLICSGGFSYGFFHLQGRDRLVMGICALVALTALVVYCVVLRADFFREIRRRMHTS